MTSTRHKAYQSKENIPSLQSSRSNLSNYSLPTHPPPPPPRRRLSSAGYIHEQYSPTSRRKSSVHQKGLNADRLSNRSAKNSSFYGSSQILSTSLVNPNSFRSASPDPSTASKKVQFLNQANLLSRLKPDKDKSTLNTLFRKFRNTDQKTTDGNFPNSNTKTPLLDHLDLETHSVPVSHHLNEHHFDHPRAELDSLQNINLRRSKFLERYKKDTESLNQVEVPNESNLGFENSNEVVLRTGNIRNTNDLFKQRTDVGSSYDYKPVAKDKNTNNSFVHARILTKDSGDKQTPKSTFGAGEGAARSLNTKENRKTKYSPPPDLASSGIADSATKTNLSTNKNTDSGKSVSKASYLQFVFNMFGSGIKLKERFVIGASIVAVLFTLLLVMDLQLDLGMSGHHLVPSHGRVRYVHDEDGPGAAYNSFKKRFLQKTHR